MTSPVRLFATPWTVSLQTPVSVGFLRQESSNGLTLPSPGDVPDPGIELASPALAGVFFTSEPIGKPHLLGREGKKNLIEFSVWSLYLK